MSPKTAANYKAFAEFQSGKSHYVSECSLLPAVSPLSPTTLYDSCVDASTLAGLGRNIDYRGWRIIVHLFSLHG